MYGGSDYVIFSYDEQKKCVVRWKTAGREYGRVSFVPQVSNSWFGKTHITVQIREAHRPLQNAHEGRFRAR